MHSSSGTMSLLDHGALEYCSTSVVSDLGWFIVGRKFIGILFAILCLCKENCASTLNRTDTVCLSFAVGKLTTC